MNVSGQPEAEDAGIREEARALLDATKDKPSLFAYTPSVPRLLHGLVESLDEAESDYAVSLRKQMVFEAERDTARAQLLQAREALAELIAAQKEWDCALEGHPSPKTYANMDDRFEAAWQRADSVLASLSDHLEEPK